MMYLLYAGQDLEKLLIDGLSSGGQDSGVFFRYQEVSAEGVQNLLLRFDLLPLGYEACGFLQDGSSFSVGSFNMTAHIRAVRIQATDSSSDTFQLLVKISPMFVILGVLAYFCNLAKVLDNLAIALDDILLHI